MSPRLRLVVLATLTGCAGHLTSTSKATSVANPDDAFNCVQLQLKNLSYYRNQYDTGDRWIRSQKIDSVNKTSSGLFRRRYDKMEVKVKADASGNTNLEFLLSTTDEFATAAGLVQEQKPASDGVKQDAAEVAKACASPGLGGLPSPGT